MRARILLALLPALAVVPAAPASAVTRGAAELVYASVPSADGAVVSFACAAAPIGVYVATATCSITPGVAIARTSNAQVAAVAGTSYTLTLRLVVRDLVTFASYSCLRSVTVATALPAAGELGCRA